MLQYKVINALLTHLSAENQIDWKTNGMGSRSNYRTIRRTSKHSIFPKADGAPFYPMHIIYVAVFWIIGSSILLFSSGKRFVTASAVAEALYKCTL